MVIVGLEKKGKGCKDKEVGGGKQEGHGEGRRVREKSKGRGD